MKYGFISLHAIISLSLKDPNIMPKEKIGSSKVLLASDIRLVQRMYGCGKYPNSIYFHKECHWRQNHSCVYGFYEFYIFTDEKCKNQLTKSKCKSYKRKGYCKKKKKMNWMARRCKKTCKFCYSVCKDKRRFQCKKKAKSKNCNDKEMMEKCPKLCGLC